MTQGAANGVLFAAVATRNPLLLLLQVATMGWCGRHHQALFVIIHNKELPVTTNVLHQVFSPYGEVENITKFQTMW